MTDTNIDYTLLSTVSTSTTLSRVRGFTINLLFALKEGPRRTYELMEISGKPREYVYSYLKRMRKYGLVMKNGFFWNLTVPGSDFVSYLEEVSKYSIVCRHIENRRETEERQKRDTSPLKKLKQVSIQSWLRDFTPDDTERVVVEVLLDHYNKTKGKFIYASSIYDLAERFGVNPSLLPDAMRKLHEDQVIYQWPLHPRLGEHFKVGLKKDFIRKLEESQK